jgi:hypothetical protein
MTFIVKTGLLLLDTDSQAEGRGFESRFPLQPFFRSPILCYDLCEGAGRPRAISTQKNARRPGL